MPFLPPVEAVDISSVIFMCCFCCSADGNYHITTMTKATLYSTGLVKWEPPAIFKSSCDIDVRYFPFDEQTCWLKFGSWTFDGFQVYIYDFISVHNYGQQIMNCKNQLVY